MSSRVRVEYLAVMGDSKGWGRIFFEFKLGVTGSGSARGVREYGVELGCEGSGPRTADHTSGIALASLSGVVGRPSQGANRPSVGPG